MQTNPEMIRMAWVAAIAFVFSLVSAESQTTPAPESSGDRPQPAIRTDVQPSVATGIPGSSSAGQSSDLRLKRNVTPITNALPVILNLRGVCFQWRSSDFPHRHFDDSRHIGFIAQEMRSVLPQVIGKDAEDYYTIATGEIIPVLVEALKDMNLTLQQQKAMIQQKDRKLANMESRLTELDRTVSALTNQVQELLQKSQSH
jgi:hypothetical protein